MLSFLVPKRDKFVRNPSSFKVAKSSGKAYICRDGKAYNSDVELKGAAKSAFLK